MSEQKKKRLTVRAETIRLECGCGGDVVNGRRSVHIEQGDEQVFCEKCGAVYTVPAHYFQRIYANTVLEPREQKRENDFHLMVRQWDRSPNGHGSLEEQTVSWAWMLYSKHGCTAAGVCATMREQANALETAGNPDLAAMYRKFVQDVESPEE